MIRAIKLEWLKISKYRKFWILIAMYMIALMVVSSLGTFFLAWLKIKGADFQGIDPTIIPIYDFPDIWQNLAYLASIFKVLPAFIVIISVSNDISSNTLRQNIIDGLSKWEYFLSKFGLILTLALLSMIMLLLSGMVNGFLYSSVIEAYYIFDELEFVLAAGWEVLVYCTMAFLLTLIIKRTGFAIVILLFYTVIFEPILVAIINYSHITKNTLFPQFTKFLPVQSLHDLINIPFGRYIFLEIEDNVPLLALVISLIWLIIYVSGIMYVLIKKDLK